MKQHTYYFDSGLETAADFFDAQIEDNYSFNQHQVRY
jgi:hypothetical protein